MLLGVTHTERTISTPQPRENIQEVLSNNATTYKPCSVFSAGTCSIIETLADGRLLIEIAMRERFRSVSQVQAIPFEIHRCEPYQDGAMTVDTEHEAAQLKAKIVKRLSALFTGDDTVQALLDCEAITNASPSEFSFEIFQLIRLDPNDMQEILELTCPVARLTRLLAQLNQHP